VTEETELRKTKRKTMQRRRVCGDSLRKPTRTEQKPSDGTDLTQGWEIGHRGHREEGW
jgi:hypothetical protein